MGEDICLWPRFAPKTKDKERLRIRTALTHPKLNICPVRCFSPSLERQTPTPIYRACRECNAEEEEERKGRGLECEKVKKGERDDIGAPVPQIATHAREGDRTRAFKLNVKGRFGNAML